jgi:hypothetical protein
MLTPRALEIVRRFAENGMKLLLEDPANVRDLLGLTARRRSPPSASTG